MACSDETITADNLQRMFYKSNFSRYEIVTPNTYIDWGYGEADILGVRKSGYIDEIEIKISRPDFLADFKKTVSVMLNEGDRTRTEMPKHKALKGGFLPCNRFSFLLPKDLAEKCEIPEYAGLYVLTHRNYISEVKRAPLLHKRKISDLSRNYLGQKMAYRYWQLILSQKGAM